MVNGAVYVGTYSQYGRLYKFHL
ncbi:MAG: hypothetical protein ACLQDY_08540 [Streptosporangiaceae bacterium]